MLDVAVLPCVPSEAGDLSIGTDFQPLHLWRITPTAAAIPQESSNVSVYVALATVGKGALTIAPTLMPSRSTLQSPAIFQNCGPTKLIVRRTTVHDGASV